MKKLSLIVVSLSIISLFSQCGKDPGDKKLKSPSTGYKYYISSDSTKKENPDTVINTQTIVFEATNFDGADYYSVFIGSYNIGTSDGVNLEKNSETKVFSITHDAVNVPGTYKIYMVATNVNLTTGKINRVVDSSKTIVVFDPTLSQAVITDFKISQAGLSKNGVTTKVLTLKDAAKTKVSFPITPKITADSILYEDVNPKYFPIFRTVYFDLKATSDLIYINDSTNQNTYTPLSIDILKGNYIFNNGCKIKIQSKDGTATKIYSIAIHYLKI